MADLIAGSDVLKHLVSKGEVKVVGAIFWRPGRSPGWESTRSRSLSSATRPSRTDRSSLFLHRAPGLVDVLQSEDLDIHAGSVVDERGRPRERDPLR